MKFLALALCFALAASAAAAKVAPVPLPFPCDRWVTHTASGKTSRVWHPCPVPKPCPPLYTTHRDAKLSESERLSLAPCFPCVITHRTVLPDGSEKVVRRPCFTPLPQPTKKPDCSPCRSSRECLGGKCWGSPLLCTNGKYSSLLRCGYKAECGDCTSSLQCATMKCWGGKCVFDTKKSMRRCFPKH